MIDFIKSEFQFFILCLTTLFTLINPIGIAPLLMVMTDRFAKSDKISIMIRPENIEIYKKKNNSKKGDFFGLIKSKIYLGSTIQYQVEIKDGPVILINVNNSKFLNYQDFSPDEEVWVNLSKNAIYPII